ncbi:MAG: aldehyde dehydrogenase family protein, partial [Gaiellaceae bacterium]
GSAGERCMAVSMLVAVGDAGDELVGAIKQRLPKVKVGDGMDPDAEMGPLVTREHRDKVASYIDRGRTEGATVVTDGRETAPDGDGFFLGVTLLDDVKPEMDVYKDEIFGPVLGITRVDTYEEAVRLVNENPYGNGVAIFTRDGGVARQFQFEVNAGMVGVNVPIPVPVAYYSFGGWKNSLFGDLHIYETGAKHGKRVQALGGAKNHMVVMPDANLEQAVDALIGAAYGSAGERCMAISQVVAVGDAGDRLVEAIQQRLPKIKVGDGLEPDVEMGPLVTREHRDKVASYIDGAREQGAEVVADGRESAPESDGFFLGVSLLDNVTPEMDAYKDEIFGPVLGVTRVATYNDAVRLVNENPYGNGTAIFTRDGGVARQFQFEAQAGMVGINVPIPVPVAYYSFGGWKNSLFGDTHIYGPEGINFYTRGKVVTSRWPDPATSKVDLGFPQTR